MPRFSLAACLSAATLVASCGTIPRDLASFSNPTTACYDRKTEPYTAVVDTHLHFRPFGGEAIPLAEMTDYFRKTGVRFANMYGIGQILPVDSSCTYYLDCPGTPAQPSIKNDFVNAANLLELKPRDVHLTLSMTFPDLAKPADIVGMIQLYDKEYPQMFKWMGEVNLIKQALLHNHHQPASKQEIDQWEPFMRVLRERKIPINIHADLGNDKTPTEFLSLFEYALQRYPNNTIVWAHMGLSKELSKMPAAQHVQIVQSLLDKYPHLMLDISWRVLYDNYFSKPEARKLYVELLNRYSERILPGTDFVASRAKQFEVYREELEVTSDILKDVNDTAFRNIALGQSYFTVLGMRYQAPQVCRN